MERLVRSLILSELLVVFVLLLLRSAESRSCSKSTKLHRKVYSSQPFFLRPGDVEVSYKRIEFPSGHLGVKNFMVEVVDELGISVPLSEVYLHHWAVFQFHVPSSEAETLGLPWLNSSSSGARIAGNDGVCQNSSLRHFWGLGSETRHTNYSVPGSYAVPVGDPARIPDGFEAAWILNIHAIDIRETEDPQGCLECRCYLYNTTTDELGEPLRSDYKGGFDCCHEGTRCKVKKDGPARKFYTKYTIEWVEWDECVSPVRVYIFDITDDGERDPMNRRAGCKSEYDVPACERSTGNNKCVHEKKSRLVIPHGGNFVYGVSHQHAGGQGMIVHGEDGRHVCSSIPVYGQGTAAGDEAGHIVGMSTCYPEIGAVSLADGETLQFSSYYESSREHTGVMGLFYVLVTDDSSLDHAQKLKVGSNARENTRLILAVVVVTVLAALIGFYIGFSKRPGAYKPL